MKIPHIDFRTSGIRLRTTLSKCSRFTVNPSHQLHLSSLGTMLCLVLDFHSKDTHTKSQSVNDLFCTTPVSGYRRIIPAHCT
jgi:hypothetical protein